MAFQTNEISLEGGSPIELYELNIDQETFYFTSSEEPFEFVNHVYDPVEVSRSTITVGTEERTQTISFNLPTAHPFVQKFVDVVPGKKATLTIFRFHRYDTAPQERVTMFKGLVQSVAFTKNAEVAKVAVMPLTGSLGRQIPRVTYQGVCNHVLFDARCKVDAGSFEYVGNASAINGDLITVDGLLGAKGAGWATGGFIQDDAGSDFRLILSQATNDVRVLIPFSNQTPIIGTDVSVFAGCAHTLAVCKTKFNNVINYGGFQFVPTKNPFATGL